MFYHGATPCPNLFKDYPNNQTVGRNMVQTILMSSEKNTMNMSLEIGGKLLLLQSGKELS
jgi:hypothetical protein